jgi:hypothetical protein
MWKQVKDFVPSRGGTKPYWCLANVRAGYAIQNLLPDAWTAWQQTEQHKNRTIPAGVDVPLFYSYTATLDGVNKNWGHINVRLSNGTIWNDGIIYPNLKSFEIAYSNVSYVGWGESVNNERVIKKEDDLYKGKSAKYWYDQYITYKGHTVTWRTRYESLFNRVKTALGKYLGK